MLTNALKTLSNPPSARERKQALVTINARVAVLQSQLGITPTMFQFNSAKATALLTALESQLAAKNIMPAIAAAAPASVAPAATIAACAKAVFDTAAAETLEGQRLQFTRAGLTIPGLEPAAANPNFTPKFTGLARTVRADRQSKIDAFFNPKH
jgi:hypothetical protein